MKKHCHKPHNRPGFTLIELLVVITIVVILAALAFVTSSQVRQRAKESAAINSLRQIGIAHVAYSTEHHGAVNTINPAGVDDAEFSDTFWGRMQPYIFSGIDTGIGGSELRQFETAINALFQSSDARTMIGTPYSGIPEFLEFGLSVPIGFNEVLQPTDGRQVRMNVFGDPSRIIYTAYGREFFNSTHGATFTSMPQNGGPGGPGIYYLENGTAIMCFLDGHVETDTAPMPRRLFGEDL